MQAFEQLINHTVHNLAHRTIFTSIQTCEVRHTTRSPHATQKAIPFYQQHSGAVPGSADAGGQSGRSTAHNNDINSP